MSGCTPNVQELRRRDLAMAEQRRARRAGVAVPSVHADGVDPVRPVVEHPPAPKGMDGTFTTGPDGSIGFSGEGRKPELNPVDVVRRALDVLETLDSTRETEKVVAAIERIPLLIEDMHVVYGWMLSDLSAVRRAAFKKTMERDGIVILKPAFRGAEDHLVHFRIADLVNTVKEFTRTAKKHTGTIDGKPYVMDLTATVKELEALVGEVVP